MSSLLLGVSSRAVDVLWQCAQTAAVGPSADQYRRFGAAFSRSQLYCLQGLVAARCTTPS
eukprot:6787020-Prymnesium_polylepis.1